MELLDDVNKLFMASINFKDLLKGCPVNGVKYLCEINKDNIQRLVLLCCLLLKLAQSEDHVRSRAAFPESTLTIRENFFQNELQRAYAAFSAGGGGGGTLSLSGPRVSSP